MSTNAYIAIQNAPEDFKVIYLHWDGYPSHAMKTLLENYNSEEQARALITLGDLSSLDTTLETNVYYHRDREEDWLDVRPIGFNKFEGIMWQSSNDFLYIWMDGKWNAYKYGEEIPDSDWAVYD